MVKRVCAFCGAETEFLSHSENLCLGCGDKVQSYGPEETLEMAKRFATTATLYKAQLPKTIFYPPAESKDELTYLASPYTHPDILVRQIRFEQVTCKAAQLFFAGHFVFSPIAHGHPLTKYDTPSDWEFWKLYCIKMLQLCDTMTVLMLDGWKESKGVVAEIAIASSLNMHINYILESTILAERVSDHDKEEEAET